MGYAAARSKTRDGSWTRNIRCEQIVAGARRVERAALHATQADRIQIDALTKMAHELINKADAIAAKYEAAVLDHTETTREREEDA
jgi:hypothetical protein